MSENSLISIIWNRPSLKRKWDKLTDTGKRRVLSIANGSDFMLETIIEDVYDEEHGR
jgi:hypothetical protein